MRVVIVVHGYPPNQLGGTEVHTQALARRLVAGAHDVRIFAVGGGGDEGRRSVSDDVDGAVAVRRVTASPRPDEPVRLNDPWVRAEFERFLDETGADVVHVQHLLHLSGDLIEAADHRSVPTVVTLHDSWFRCPAIHPRPRVRHPRGRCWGIGCVWHHDLRHPRRLASLAMGGTLIPALAGTLRRPGVLRRQLACADALLAPSRFILEAFARFGIPGEKLRFVPHGTPLSITAGYPRPAGPVRFGFVGSVVPLKGVDVLCRAFARLAGASTLHIHGPAYDPEYLRRLRTLFGPRIRYEGPFAPDDAASVYGSLDVLVLPSLVDESFALTIAEAQACGLPVIGSRVGALPERIAHGRDGLLVPPGNARALGRALARLGDPTEVSRLAANVRPPRSMSSYADEVEGIYAGLASRGKKGSSPDRLAWTRQGGSGE